MVSLERPWPEVEAGGRRLYGGSQMLSTDAVLRRCGCGPVAALDTLRYLQNDSAVMPLADYDRALKALCPRYFPLIPPFGINGLVFVLGLNRLLRDRGLPCRAVWMVSGRKLWTRVEEQLRHDLPVILSVGSNFPLVWENNRLPLYRRLPDGSFRKAAATKGHFVTATGLDDTWLRVSSWGREYYINRKEYEHYTKEHSNYVFGNMIGLKKRKMVTIQSCLS